MKVDIIAMSRKRGYKIAFLTALGAGVLFLIIGFIMLSGVTPTVTPNKLEISMTNLKGAQPSYTTTISKDEVITINTGKGSTALTEPIVFDLDEDGKKIIHSIEPMYRGGITVIALKDTAVTGDIGTLTISCGSKYKVTIQITIYKKDLT